MNEKDSYKVAQAIGGEPWNSGGNIWLVLCTRTDGRLAVVSDEAVTEYENREAFDKNQPSAVILLH